MGKRLKIFGKKSQFDINVYKTSPILLPMSRNTIGGKKCQKIREVDFNSVYLFLL